VLLPSEGTANALWTKGGLIYAPPSEVVTSV